MAKSKYLVVIKCKKGYDLAGHFTKRVYFSNEDNALEYIRELDKEPVESIEIYNMMRRYEAGLDY